MLKCSNFFVFQSYEIRFSGFFNQFLIRSFPESFCVNFISWKIPTITSIPNFGLFF